MKKYVIKFGTILAGFALMITALNVNTACLFVAHQPILPTGAEKLRKF
ncbi:MAG: cyclic lactone autoinducer peptide [Sedimentibacter sp.]